MCRTYIESIVFRLYNKYYSSIYTKAIQQTKFGKIIGSRRRGEPDAPHRDAECPHPPPTEDHWVPP